jgi:2-polyprenyl-6-hydroxyphenyl methylase/3-demethylubiquinone-9 3-methyltransferase
MSPSASIDKNEMKRFDAQAQDWWNPNGVWRPLHKLNPARLEYIQKQIVEHFGPKNIKELSVLDIGCGGGLLCEPLARSGAKVTGIDASAKTIEAARAHAKSQKLRLDYQTATAEDFARSSKTFDVVLAMEILEHVADIGSFLRSAASLIKPGGILIVSTVNRTRKSWFFGIVIAEYVLGWVPAGMHDWDKFIRPSELAAHLEKAGLALADLTGVTYNPIKDSFSLKRGKMDINYLAAAGAKAKENPGT